MLFVDDSPIAIKAIEALLKKHFTNIKLTGIFTDPVRAIAELKKMNVDLLFLDVEMPGMTGFELLEKHKSFNGGVVFITAHSHYAAKAFKFSAVDFLIKPVQKAEFVKAVEKFRKINFTKPGEDTLQQLIKNLSYMARPGVPKIAVSTAEGIEVVRTDEINYFKSESNYTLIKRTGKKDILVSKTLKDFEEALALSQFIRVHQSYLININKVERYLRAEGGYAVMQDGSQITISRRHKENFMKVLKRQVPF